MSWKLQDSGGSFQQRISIANKKGIVDGDDLYQLRARFNIIKNIENDLYHFIEILQSSIRLGMIDIPKRINVIVKVYNSFTFDTSSCIAWIKKTKQNCHGQCGAKRKEGMFCGFHRSSKTHRVPIKTIYDNIEKHILEYRQFNITANSGHITSNQISGCNLIYWRGIYIYVNPSNSHIYMNHNGYIRHIGDCSDSDESIYTNYKRLVESKI